MQPRQRRETLRPVEPRRTYSMELLQRKGAGEGRGELKQARRPRQSPRSPDSRYLPAGEAGLSERAVTSGAAMAFRSLTASRRTVLNSAQGGAPGVARASWVICASLAR